MFAVTHGCHALFPADDRPDPIRAGHAAQAQHQPAPQRAGRDCAHQIDVPVRHERQVAHLAGGPVRAVLEAAGIDPETGRRVEVDTGAAGTESR